MIRRDVESLVLFGDLHRLDRFARRDVENVQQDRLGLAVIVNPLYNLVNATVTCKARKAHADVIFSFKEKERSRVFSTVLSMLTGAGVVDRVIQIDADKVDAQLVDDQSREHDVPLVEDRFLVLVRDRGVH